MATAATGIVDAVAFLGLGQIFTAFTTGDLLFLGFALAGAKDWSPSGRPRPWPSNGTGGGFWPRPPSPRP